MSSQQPTVGSTNRVTEVSERVYLESYEELRKSGKCAEEAYQVAKHLSTAVGLVIQSNIALRAIVLYINEATIDKEEEEVEESSHGDSAIGDGSSTNSGDEQDSSELECHVIPMK